jgi:hypothetical protein
MCLSWSLQLGIIKIEQCSLCHNKLPLDTLYALTNIFPTEDPLLFNPLIFIRLWLHSTSSLLRLEHRFPDLQLVCAREEHVEFWVDYSICPWFPLKIEHQNTFSAYTKWHWKVVNNKKYPRKFMVD